MVSKGQRLSHKLFSVSCGQWSLNDNCKTGEGPRVPPVGHRVNVAKFLITLMNSKLISSYQENRFNDLVFTIFKCSQHKQICYGNLVSIYFQDTERLNRSYLVIWLLL